MRLRNECSLERQNERTLTISSCGQQKAALVPRCFLLPLSMALKPKSTH